MYETDHIFTGILFSNLEVINRHFESRREFFRVFRKFVSFRYGFVQNLKTLLVTPWCCAYYPGFPYSHGPIPLLKSTLEEVWEKELDKLSETSEHKFRSFSDVNQYLFTWWQWCKGDFVPRRTSNKLKFISVNMTTEDIKSMIEESNCPMICVNDASIDDFKEKQSVLIDAFETVLGQKSQFEL